METLEDVLHKDMTRKEFLATIGFGVASLFGIATMLHFLTGKHFGHGARITGGYGSNVYGR